MPSNSSVTSQIIAVHASAGSGKTYALAKRYIKLIFDSYGRKDENPFSKILAITFTNKAASSIKAKILGLLKTIALGAYSNSQDESEFVSYFAIDRVSLKNMAVMAIDDLMREYSYFQVRTIDSFIKNILESCAFKIDLSPNFNVKKNNKNYLLYSLDENLFEAAGDKTIHKIFSDFLNHYIFIENNTSWFLRQNIFETIKALYLDAGNYAQKPGVYGTKHGSLLSLKKKIWKEMHELSIQLPDAVDLRFVSSLNKFVENNKNGSFDIKDISSFFERPEYPARKGSVVSLKTADKWDEIRKHIKIACEMEAFSFFNSYVEILNLTFAKYEKRKKDEDILFLGELNKQGQQIFENNSLTAAEIYYRLATRINHYLIDEFQDTSKLQMANLKLMLHEALSTGGSVFYVGDKKQSIYRFRGAKSSLFDEIISDFSQYPYEKQYLGKNYRSQAQIIKFNNEIFSIDNLKRFIEDIKDKQDEIGTCADFIVSPYEQSSQSIDDGNMYGTVEVEIIDEANKSGSFEVIRQKIIALINRLKSNTALGNIVLLCRTNDEVEIISGWLSNEKIPVESDKTLNIKKNPLIKQILSFLKYWDCPENNIYFASFILGDIFVSAAKIDRNKIEEFVFENSGNITSLARLFEAEYPEIYKELILNLEKQKNLVPLYEFMLRMYQTLNIFDSFKESHAYLIRFIRIIKESENEFRNISSFLKYFDEMEEDIYIESQSADAVKVMTAHKAKGLEFGTVIVPFLAISMNSNSGRAHRSYVINDEGDHLALIRLRKIYSGYSQKLKEMSSLEYAKNLQDEINRIYVTFTRAKNELYIFIPGKSGLSENMAQKLIPREFYKLGTGRQYAVKKNKEEVLNISAMSGQDIGSGVADEYMEKDRIINRDKIRRGDAAHYILSLIGNLDGKNVELEIENACIYASHLFIDDEILYAKKMIVNLLDNEKSKKYFYLKNGLVYSEKEIVIEDGQTKRIDRLIIFEKEVWIIDFKSADEQEKHKSQLLGYKNAIKPLFKKHKIRGVLIYLDTGRIDEIDE